MKYLMTYEALIGNKYYLNSINDLTGLDFNEMRKNVPNRHFVIYGDWNYENGYLFRIYNKISSRKNGKLDIISPNTNYIWQITKPLNIFKFDKYHFKKLSEKCPSWIPRVKNYFDFKNENIDELIDKVMEYIFKFDDYGSVNSNSFFDSIIMDENDINVFAQIYDGIEVPQFYKKEKFDNEVYVFYKILKDLKLIGGTEKLLGRKSDIEMEIPDHIIDELIRYTGDAGKRINPYVKKWLKENSPKPPTGTRLYRSFKLDLSDWGSYDKEKTWGKDKKPTDALIHYPEKLKKYLYRLTGLKELTDFKRFGEIIVKRGKESSWTYNAQISKPFAEYMASSSINVLVKYNTKQDDVIVDFTLIPEKYKNNFKYKNQNEVILETGAYKGIIQEIWLDDKFIQWLKENGYDFNSKIGINKA